MARLSPPRKDVRARVASVTPPPPPSAGGFQTLQGARFSVAYPTGWEVFGVYMIFISPQQLWPQLQPVFDKMVQSIRFR